MRLGDRINQALAELVVADPEGGAIDYGRDRVSTGRGGHGSHRGSTPPPRVHPLASEWAGFFRRALDLMELDLARLRGRAPRPEAPRQGRVASGVAARRKRRIIESELYRGRPAEFVAYVEGCSADLVRKVRGERGLDPYGLPVKRDRLTAPPSEGLKTSESTTTEEG